MKINSRCFYMALLCLLFSATLIGQDAKLSFQGILKKSNGIAVDDGAYAITFNLYTTEVGGTPIWSETQNEVEIIGGLYSVFLGDENPLNIPFDAVYYLGVKVAGSGELSPRYRLTSAPYALSLIGNTNTFPSSGTVKGDEIIIAGKAAVGTNMVSPTHTMSVNGGIVAKGGEPGANGGNNAGYAFKGNSGDDDSGLFSKADGEVSIYSNNAERLKANGNGVEVTGNQAVSGNAAVNGTLNVGSSGIPGDVNLSKNGKVSYDGMADWRLVFHDNFESGFDGWKGYEIGNPLGTSLVEEPIERFPFPSNSKYTPSHCIRPIDSNNPYLKKKFNLAGIPHTEIKVTFTFYAFRSWDNELAFAGFWDGSSTPPTIAWDEEYREYGNFFDLDGNGAGDKYSRGEMTAWNSDNEFWVIFGCWLGGSAADEHYGVGDIKIWVR